MRRWRLFPKYALLIITLVGGMLVASGAIGIWFSWSETQALLKALQAEKAESAATRIEEYVKNIGHEMSWTALPAVQGGDALEQRRIEYLKLQRQEPAITEVVWIDPGGREQLRVSRLAMDAVSSGTDLSQEPKFREVASGRTSPYYGPVYFRKGTEPYMTIARPAGSGGGVTAAEVNLKFVWDVVSKIRIGQAGLAYVVDSTGTLIAHPDISLVLKKSDLSSLPQVAALATPERASPNGRDLKGAEVFSAHAAIPTLHWTVFVDSPREEAFAPLYASIVRTVLLLGAGLLVSVVASFFVARALVRPLQALRDGAARIGAGELDRRIEVSTGDELESLAEQFNKMGSELKGSYADLERKVDARTAELTTALKQQTATSEVLKLISRSTFDLDVVLRTLLESASSLCAAESAVLFRPDADGNYLPFVIHSVRDDDHADYLRKHPVRAGEGSASGRALLHRATVHIADVRLDPKYERHDLTEAGGYRNVLAVPLLREGEPIGVIALSNSFEGASFTPGQIELVTTFADQAVIAIENARLFNETKEALERQTATADVLQVISGSMADAHPVFIEILESCKRLFASAEMGITLVGDDGIMRLAAHLGTARDAIERFYPRPVDQVAIRMGMDGAEVVHITDVLARPEMPAAMKHIAEQIGNYSILLAPLIWEGRNVGSIHVVRQPPSPFSDKEIALLKVFADQAVIAIQNARLFNETKEALEQQTATAEILRVISSSVADSAPVFEKILESCQRLFASSEQGVLLVGDDGMLHLGAHHGSARERLEKVFPFPRDTDSEAVSRSRRMIHIKDILADADVPPGLRAFAERVGLGTYSQVVAPMLWEGESVGSLYVIRQPAVGFSDKEISLLRTFADQAMIAIQNARLFNETRDALEQQTATAEVLQVISTSVADTQPVFDKILDSCERLFAATGLGIYLVDDAGMLRPGAFRRKGEGESSFVPAVSPRPVEGTATALVLQERRVIHYPDVLGATDAPPSLRRMAKALGNYSIAMAPMIWEGRGVGAIQVTRDPPEPFTDKELALLKTFADQAVIAIQNSRLFNEIESKSRELELANKHKSEFLANMSHELRTPLNAIIGFSEVLSEKMFGEVNDKQLEYLLDIHSSGHHLLSLINDILDLSKIEAGRMELDLAGVNLPMLLDNCTTLVRERASRQGLALALDIEDGVGDWVADVRKVKQIVINLLSNAVKFTPAGGRVTLRARRLEHAVEIAVVDTGVGIARDQQAIVFEEFRQAGGDYLRKSEGTGLGLSLAKRFAELHGGSIRVESEPGQGSTFAFILPERMLEAV